MFWGFVGFRSLGFQGFRVYLFLGADFGTFFQDDIPRGCFFGSGLLVFCCVSFEVVLGPFQGFGLHSQGARVFVPRLLKDVFRSFCLFLFFVCLGSPVEPFYLFRFWVLL